jgi:hypothetical protein
MLSVVCTVHKEMRSVSFLVEPQPRSTVCLWFCLKTTRTVSPALASKLVATVFQFGPKTDGDGFSRFGLKIAGLRFPDLGLKSGSYGLVIWASKSPQRFLGLGLKIKQAMVC